MIQNYSVFSFTVDVYFYNINIIIYAVLDINNLSFW